MQPASFRWPSAEELTRLVREAQGAREGAVDELLAVLRPPLVSFFRRRLSPDFAEDLAQLALIRINGAHRRIDPDRADVYIVTVARNLLRTAYRQHARDRKRATETAPADLPTTTMTADRRVEYEELVRRIHRACLAKLRPGLREVAVGLIRGATPLEIATELRVSPITIRTRLMKARAILRSELSSYVDEDPHSGTRRA